MFRSSFAGLNISFESCLDSKPQEECATEDEIDSYMKTLFLFVGVDFLQLDTQDDENPLHGVKKLYQYDSMDIEDTKHVAWLQLAPNVLTDKNDPYQFGPFGGNGDEYSYLTVENDQYKKVN